MLKRPLFAPLLVLFCLLCPLHSRAEDATVFPSVPTKIDLQDGDTFVFLGDSITHQRLYTQYVEDFFYQRFPDRRINFHNAGVGGARAWDALARVSQDVLQYKPRYVSILLGMNDGSYQPFNPDIFATYSKDMTNLVSQLKEGGATPILMSPTMFDSRAARIRVNPRRPRSPEMLAQYNSVLAYYGRWLQEQAVESGLSYVDMFGPLNDLTVEAREKDSSFTLIKDAIHPDPPGQIVMAFAMIDDLGLRKGLSNIRIQPSPKGFRANSSGGKVSNIKAVEDMIEFDWTATGLPWVLPPEAQVGVDMLRLGHKASKEGLEVHGLSPGTYELLIDGVSVGNYTDVSLSRHIELQANDKTPQYQQALKVAMLNKKKNEGPVKQLRDSWRVFQSWARHSRDLKTQPNNAELVKVIAKEHKRLANLEQQVSDAKAAAMKIEDEIYKANQPVTRHFVLKKVN